MLRSSPMRIERIGALALLVVVLGGVRVDAQPAAAADDATRTRAREIFQSGAASLEAGDCPSALASFREAYALVGEPSILYNLATAESECLDPVDALAHYEAFLAQVRTGRAARFRPDARRQVAALRRQLGRLAITVDGLLPTDEVRVGDRVVATDALSEVWSTAEEVQVEVRRDGVAWGSARVRVVAGRLTPVSVTLAEPPSTPAPREVAEAALEPQREAPQPLRTAPERRRRRIILGSTVAGAVVVAAVTVAVVTTR